MVEELANHRLVVTGWDESSQQETVEIVHEALIREWGTLREWIKRNREFRIWQERLKPDVREWKNKQYNPDTLLQGTRLAIALDWLKQRRDEITSLEQDFISASVKHRDKERNKQKRRRQLTVSGLVSGLMLVSTFAGISEIRRTDAEAGRTSTVAGNFFTQNDHEVALTEAIKAGKLISKSIWKPWVTKETKMKVVSTLREAVYGYQIKTLKHGEIISSTSFSPDGKTIASASYDGTVKLWDSTTGKEIKTFKGTSNGINSIAFFPDGKTIITASNDGTVKLWDISTGKEIKTHKFKDSEFNSRSSIKLSSDGEIITYLSFDGTVRQWDSDTGKEITKFKTFFGMDAFSTLLSSDAKIIVVFRPNNALDDRFKIWDTTTGKEIKTLEKYAKGLVFPVGLSPDNKTIALVSRDFTVKLLDIATGKEIKTFRVNSRLGPPQVSFSPDGKTIAFAYPGIVKGFNFFPCFNI
ncbi:MAG: WD40 repeat domain-containing protein [Cyanobacteria bacterium J06628_3]